MTLKDITDKVKYGLLTYVGTHASYHLANALSASPYERPSIINSFADAGEQVAIMLTVRALTDNVFRGIEDECTEQGSTMMLAAGIAPHLAQIYQSGSVAYGIVTTTAAVVTAFSISEHIDLRRNRREGKTLL